jgi:cysteinyl-tRNA synthetase
MSRKYLGDTFDIHAGGKDLLFPHHENEVAQSECATGCTFANYWMHNGFINIDNEKMSKSAGNFFTVRDILQQYEAEDIRMFMLSAHYRSPVNFSKDMMSQAHASLQRLYTARDNMYYLMNHADEKALSDAENALLAKVEESRQRFISAMDDDMNTADAMGALFEIVKEANITLNDKSSKQAIAGTLDTLSALADVMGLLTRKPPEEALPEDIQALVDARADARKSKNCALSDQLRDQLKELGYSVEDTAKGQKVQKLAK